jgi:predicted RNA-binding Zn ribbon-like protein
MSGPTVTEADATAPGALAVVQALLNTADLEAGTDELSDLAALSAWLRDQGLAGADDAFALGDLERVVAVREALRRLLPAHGDGAADPEAVHALRDAARAAPLVVTVSDAGAPTLAPLRAGVDGALARLLGIVARAEADGTWARLKVCAAEDCRWAFYDFSRNRSRTWCTMSVCGNRAKARAYRQRGARRRGA